MYYFKILLMLILLSFVLLSCESDSENPVISTDPTISIISPVNNQGVSDYVNIIVAASDNKGIAKVEFFVDAQLFFVDAVVPYEAVWNSSHYPNGSEHSLYAVVYDTDGIFKGSSVVNVTIDSSLGEPETTILYPADSIGNHEAKIIWSMNSDPDFSHYYIRYDTSTSSDPSANSIMVANASDTSLIITDLIDNSDYRIQVEVRDLFSKSSKSNIVELTTLDAPPPQPRILLIQNNIDYKTISWAKEEMVDFFSYELFYSIDSIYDDNDVSITTIHEYSTVSFDYYTSDTATYYYFLVLTDNNSSTTISEPFFSESNPQVNYALDFDGTNYATVPFFSALNVGDSYTLEAWVYQRAANTFDRVIDKSPTGSPYLQYSLMSGSEIGADLCNGNGPERYHANTGVKLNEWHHIALTYDAGLITYFINGQVVDTDSTGITNTCEFPTSLNIGRRKLFNEFYFRGIIDEVRVWSVVRTPSEVNNVYNKHLIGNETGLVAYYNLNEGSGDMITSPVGGNGHLGESLGEDNADPTWVESTAPIQ